MREKEVLTPSPERDCIPLRSVSRISLADTHFRGVSDPGGDERRGLMYRVRVWIFGGLPAAPTPTHFLHFEPRFLVSCGYSGPGFRCDLRLALGRWIDVHGGRHDDV